MRKISTNAELLKFISQSSDVGPLTRGEQIKTVLVTPGKPRCRRTTAKPTTIYQLGIEERAPVITAVIPAPARRLQDSLPETASYASMDTTSSPGPK